MSDLHRPEQLHDLLTGITAALPELDPLPAAALRRARHRRTSRLLGSGLGALVLAGALGVGAAFAAGHSGGSGPSRITVPPAGSPSSGPGRSSAAPVPSRSPNPRATSGPTGAPAPTPSRGASRVADSASCSASQLRLSLGRAGGTAGSIYYPLRFTNTASTACTLFGYPGVSYVNAVGAQVGAAAARSAVGPITTLRLRPGGSASALVRETDPGVYPADQCRLSPVAGLRVYPPGSRRSVMLTQPGHACAGPMVGLTVGNVVANATGT